MCKHQRTDSDAMSVDKPDLLAEMQSALRQLVPQSHHGWRLFKGKPCNSDLGESNVNTQLWRQYSSKRDLVRDSLRHHRTCPWANCLAPPVDQLAALFHWIWLDVQANEVLLLHGTSKETADKIAKQGFDERLCQKGLYGRSSSKRGHFRSQANLPCTCNGYCHRMIAGTRSSCLWEEAGTGRYDNEVKGQASLSFIFCFFWFFVFYFAALARLRAFTNQ